MRTLVPQRDVGVRHDEAEDGVGEHPRERGHPVRGVPPESPGRHHGVEPHLAPPSSAKAHDLSRGPPPAATLFPPGGSEGYPPEKCTIGKSSAVEEPHSHEPRATAGRRRPWSAGLPGLDPRDRSAAAPAPDSQHPNGAKEPEGRRKRPKRPKRTGWRRAVPTWRMVLGGVLLLALLLVGGFVAGYQIVDIPAANASATAQANVYLYADGKTVIARDGEINRENIPSAASPAPSSTPYSPRRTGTSTRRTPSTSRPPSAPAGTPSPARAGRAAPPSPSSTSRTTTSARNRPSSARPRSSSSPSSSTANRARTRSSRATSTPATSAATPTASRPPPTPTTARTSRTSTRARAPISPPCSTPPAPTTSSPTPRTGRPSSPAGTTCSTAWSNTTGSPPRTATR